MDNNVAVSVFVFIYHQQQHEFDAIKAPKIPVELSLKNVGHASNNTWQKSHLNLGNLVNVIINESWLYKYKRKAPRLI